MSPRVSSGSAMICGHHKALPPEFRAGRRETGHSLDPGKPEPAKQQRQKRARQTDSKVLEESDICLFARALHDDDVGDGTRNGQIPSKCAGHCQGEPSRMRISKLSHEGFQKHYSGHVAYQVGQNCGDECTYTAIANWMTRAKLRVTHQQVG